jgi:hypothetical protein
MGSSELGDLKAERLLQLEGVFIVFGGGCTLTLHEGVLKSVEVDLGVREDTEFF